MKKLILLVKFANVFILFLASISTTAIIFFSVYPHLSEYKKLELKKTSAYFEQDINQRKLEQKEECYATKSGGETDCHNETAKIKPNASGSAIAVITKAILYYHETA